MANTGEKRKIAISSTDSKEPSAAQGRELISPVEDGFCIIIPFLVYIDNF